MTYRVGDDATLTYPITNDATPPTDLNFPVAVNARKSDGTTRAVAGAGWVGAVGPQRDLAVPLATIPAGLWALDLVIEGAADLFLGNVVIE